MYFYVIHCSVLHIFYIMQYIRVIRRERKKVQPLAPRIFNHLKRRALRMKSARAFYDFGSEKKREYEKLCALPDRQQRAAQQHLIRLWGHTLSLCTNFCRHFKIAGGKRPPPTCLLQLRAL